MADPLGRKHQIDRKPKNRANVDRVCGYAMNMERKSFQRNPSANHIYFDAYLVLFGSDKAYEMLTKAREGLE